MTSARPAVGARPAPATRVALCLGALLVALLALVPLLAAPARASSEDPTAAGDGSASDGLVVEITDLSPAVLSAGDDLTVRGTVANPTEEDLESTELRLRMQYATPISRTALERWLDPDAFSSTYLLAVEDAGPVSAGGTTTFSLTIEAAGLPVSGTGTSWGPRGLEVEVSDGAGTSGADRTFAVWSTDMPVEPTGVSILVAAVPTAGERAQDDVAAAATPRLTALIAAVERPGVGIAVDPMLLDAPTGPAEDGAGHDPAGDDEDGGDSGGDGEESGDDGGEEASRGEDPGTRSWSELLAAVTAFSGEVAVLPWADADAAALTHAGRVDLLATAQQRSEPVAAEIGALTDLLWPAGPGTDLATVSAAVEVGAAAVVVPGSQLAPADVLTYTPSGRGEISTEHGDAQALLSDGRLSAALAGQHLPVSPRPAEAPTRLDALTARQLLLADTAVITRERPNDSRSLLLTLPRASTDDAALTALTERLEVLREAPWVDLTPLAHLLAVDAPDLSRSSLPDRLTAEGEVSAATLAAVDRALATVRSFAEIIDDPESFVAPYAETLVPAISTAWRADPQARAALVAAVTEEVAGLDERVAAEPGSALLLINDVAHIPVRVSSSLDQTANVQVVLDGPDRRLHATEVVDIEVPPHGEAAAQVPVRAVGSGTAQVTVTLLSPDGAPVGTPTEITVRVRADWEDTGTAIVAALLVVLLVVGLVRTVRRGRRMVREEGEPA